MDKAKTATLKFYNIESDRLFFLVDVMGREFATSIWYKTVDFNNLRSTIGEEQLKRIVAHIAAFEMNKYGSLHLSAIDLGELRDYVDEAFVKVWSDIFVHVWGQWRYENNLPHDKAPELLSGNSINQQQDLLEIKADSAKTLTFFGGGKDSFVSSYLLRLAGIPFDVLEYSSSIYGNRAEQSDVEDLAEDVAPDSAINELAVYDDFLDSPIVEYDGESYHIHSLAAAETPASVFESIPIALARGYTALALGHEKSANYPNLLWDAEEMEPINHQWGKSLAAQKTIAAYIKVNLVSNLQYYSTLMPLSDPAIFTLFSELPWPEIAEAHSCNVTKPWCKRCAKCVYVWLFYLAFLDESKVTNEIFGGEVLFDITDNYEVLKMLAGQQAQTPFECVGQPPEAVLALSICKAKGFSQPILDELLSETSHEEVLNTLRSQMKVDEEFLRNCDLPEGFVKLYTNTVTHKLAAKYSEITKLLIGSK